MGRISMEKLKKFFSRFEENVAMILLPVMCVLVFVATVCRYTGIVSTPWSEELPRFTMIWMVMLGASACARTESHFAVRAFADRLKGKAGTVLYVITNVYVMVFCALIVYYGCKILQVQYQMSQTSTVLNVPMYYIYASIPLGCLLIVIRVIQNMVRRLRRPTEEVDKEELQ